MLKCQVSCMILSNLCMTSVEGNLNIKRCKWKKYLELRNGVKLTVDRQMFGCIFKATSSIRNIAMKNTFTIMILFIIVSGGYKFINYLFGQLLRYTLKYLERNA